MKGFLSSKGTIYYYEVRIQTSVRLVFFTQAILLISYLYGTYILSNASFFCLFPLLVLNTKSGSLDLFAVSVMNRINVVYPDMIVICDHLIQVPSAPLVAGYRPII